MLLSWYKTRGLRKQAKGLIELSTKVESLRRDILPAEDLAEQRRCHASLVAALKSKPFDDTAVTAAAEALHQIMLRNGGKVFPVTVGTDWTEMLVLAAIVAGAIRSFLLQPFKIPTNSMWPTYHGMTAEVRAPSDPVPSLPERAWGKLTQWSSTFAPVSEAEGEVLIPLQRTIVGYEPVPGTLVTDPSLGSIKRILRHIERMLRGIEREHTLVVGDVEQRFRTPDEFSIRSVYLATFFPEAARLPLAEPARWQAAMAQAEARGQIVVRRGVTCVRTTARVGRGDRLLNFDILTGDMLFVDKVRYHFVRPSAGEPFVFRTGNIPELSRQGEQYYIKRLVGQPGDTLQVRAHQLLRTGSPTPAGSPIELNNLPATDRNYFGYLARISPHDAIPLADAHTVSAHGYFAMGDNSANSYDSRGWGEVPEKDVVGPALFILYPITHRWGPAR